ncbi:MAG: LmeA family phospholipid-binding protein [Pseudonocardia sp.]|nr:LmeA family phospholipid-binding protein [Pseudonocardia sp.]
MLSPEAFRADRIELTLGRVRMERVRGRFTPAVAEEVSGVIRLKLADLAALLRQPEFVKTIMSGIDAIARLDLSLTNGDDGGLRLSGAVEVLGKRFPISTTTSLRIDNDELIVSAGRIEGLPLIGTLPVQPFDFVLPLGSPKGMAFTGVSTAPGEILLEFAGADLDLRGAVLG